MQKGSSELQKHSCSRCFRRKVKCDKKIPCSHCTRQKVDCIYRPLPAPSRKRKTPGSSSATTREGEKLSCDYTPGISPDHADGVSRPAYEAHPSSQGHKVENKFATGLWVSVADGLLHTDDMSDPESMMGSDEMEEPLSFVLGPAPPQSNAQHPSPEDILKLWGIYQANVEPLAKIIHVPTAAAQIADFLDPMTTTSTEIDVLLFAIYSAAVYSMLESQCFEVFQTSKDVLLHRYRIGTQYWLTKVKFLSTRSMTVLQALCIYLLAMRGVYDGRAMWVLTGIAIRIAQGMQLHKDGTLTGLSPFQTEIQRRLWHFLKMTDSRCAEFAGAEKFQLFAHDPNGPKKPADVNDLDLTPAMPEIPADSKYITDNSFCSMRWEFGNFVLSTRLLQGSGDKQGDNLAQALNDFEEYLRNKFTKYCNPTINYQLMIAIVATHAVQTMRFMANHPKHWKSLEEVPQEKKDLIWNLSMTMLNAFVTCHTNPQLAGFRWHMFYFFPWQCLIHILVCLQHGLENPEVTNPEAAWDLIFMLYETHPHFLTQKKRPLHIAVGQLVLKAFEVRVRLFQMQGRHLDVPDYIATLKSQRANSLQRRCLAQSSHGTASSIRQSQLLSPTPLQSASLIPDSPSLTIATTENWTEVDWQEWARLLDEWEKDLDAL